MIKHEEVRERLNYLYVLFENDIPRQYELEQYITEQEKKDELLELYRECNKEGYFWLEIQQRIEALEEEIK